MRRTSMFYHFKSRQNDLTSLTRCHHEIVEAREKLASAFDLSAPLPTRRGRDDVIAAVHDLQAQIVNGIEEALLTSLLVTEQQIIQMKEVTALNQLLEAGFKRKRDILSDNLKAIQWDISGPNALRAVIGSQGIENVSGNKFLFDIFLRASILIVRPNAFFSRRVEDRRLSHLHQLGDIP